MAKDMQIRNREQSEQSRYIRPTCFICEEAAGVITLKLEMPGVSKDKVDFLRASIQEALNDKDLLAKAAKVKRGIDPLGGEEMEKAIKEKVGSLTEKQISEFRYISFEKYARK